MAEAFDTNMEIPAEFKDVLHGIDQIRDLEEQQTQFSQSLRQQEARGAELEQKGASLLASLKKTMETLAERETCAQERATTEQKMHQQEIAVLKRRHQRERKDYCDLNAELEERNTELRQQLEYEKEAFDLANELARAARYKLDEA
ncbi:hypothetical protein NA57DRAFT_55934 [Rhizodiscina lignyota]|uniref:Uncharacterized protein n=1 Tax=Rhizodiscina lignyota TaxID=1504668 RepID=A0A9P4M741_9PEZI|nr:hypothetical protein NA57DRAFT_55934 [Rhizodiscina lignyota]